MKRTGLTPVQRKQLGYYLVGLRTHLDSLRVALRHAEEDLNEFEREEDVRPLALAHDLAEVAGYAQNALGSVCRHNGYIQAVLTQPAPKRRTKKKAKRPKP